MCLSQFLARLSGQPFPTGKVADGRLVLSLPDAETPVIWIMALADTASAVLRLETDKTGLYVIKKFSGKPAPETVAVYRDRKKADRALAIAASALEKARASSSAGVVARTSVFVKLLRVIAYLWLVVSLVMAFASAFMNGVVGPVAGVSGEKMQSSMPENLSGVPQSADDFLKNTLGSP